MLRVTRTVIIFSLKFWLILMLGNPFTPRWILVGRHHVNSLQKCACISLRLHNFVAFYALIVRWTCNILLNQNLQNCPLFHHIYPLFDKIIYEHVVFSSFVYRRAYIHINWKWILHVFTRAIVFIFWYMSTTHVWQFHV